jgi:hypothetical protein
VKSYEAIDLASSISFFSFPLLPLLLVRTSEKALTLRCPKKVGFSIPAIFMPPYSGALFGQRISGSAIHQRR